MGLDARLDSTPRSKHCHLQDAFSLIAVAMFEQHSCVQPRELTDANGSEPVLLLCKHMTNLHEERIAVVPMRQPRES